MEGLEVSLVMAQAALTAKNSSIGEAAALVPPALMDGDNSICRDPVTALNQAFQFELYSVIITPCELLALKQPMHPEQ